MGIIKTWEELEITDDFLFGKVMRNPEICKRTIEAILNIEVDHIDYPEEQKIIPIRAYRMSDASHGRASSGFAR